MQGFGDITNRLNSNTLDNRNILLIILLFFLETIYTFKSILEKEDHIAKSIEQRKNKITIYDTILMICNPSP